MTPPQPLMTPPQQRTSATAARFPRGSRRPLRAFASSRRRPRSSRAFLRLASRPADALAVATLAARNLEAVGGGSPPGFPRAASRDRRASRRAREANADALCARLRAEAMEALTRLDRSAEAKSHAVAAEKDADAAGDVDASRRAAFVRARADAKCGAVDAALAAYAALLLDMAESPRDVAAPAPAFRFERRPRGGTRDSRRGATRPPTRRRSRWTTPSPTFASSRSVSDWTTRSRTPTSFETCITPRRARWRGRFSRRRRRDWRCATREAPARFWTRRRRSAARTRATRTRGHTRASRYSARTSRDASRSETDARRTRKIVLRRVRPRTARAKAATWAWSSDAAHDRDTMRLCATEAASAFAARAAAEARAARAERAERAEDGGDEASGDAPDLPSHPSSSHPFLGRFAACVRAAHRVSSCRDALIDAAETSGCALEEALSSAEWPARDRDAAAEEEARRARAARKIRKTWTTSETRRSVAASGRARVRSPRIGRRRRRRRRVRRERREDARRARRVVRLVPRDVLRGDAPDGAGGDAGRFAAPGIRGDAVVRARRMARRRRRGKKYERARGYESSDWCISW